MVMIKGKRKVRKVMKPKIKKDWDSNRMRVISYDGEEFVLNKDRAKEVYDANVRIYKIIKSKKINRR